MPIDWRANPDEETTDWRARRGKTAHRVRREGTAKAVSSPYQHVPWLALQNQSLFANSHICGQWLWEVLKMKKAGGYSQHFAKGSGLF
ncbi:hypothetical protein [Methyloglobulus morosus]|uniref:hypothetical protein n=1 Tax=Methyloglobulus morosus TaxID=1410681 RepID=UPI00128F76EE|nr:hypothetical protein [Methyloglobulus morosus]